MFLSGILDISWGCLCFLCSVNVWLSVHLVAFPNRRSSPCFSSTELFYLFFIPPLLHSSHISLWWWPRLALTNISSVTSSSLQPLMARKPLLWHWSRVCWETQAHLSWKRQSSQTDSDSVPGLFVFLCFCPFFSLNEIFHFGIIGWFGGGLNCGDIAGGK